jgi:ribonuclease J
VPSGRVHVFNGRTLPPSVLRERQALAEEGIVSVVVRVGSSGRLAEDAHGDSARAVTVVTRGVIDEATEAALLEAARRDVRDAVNDVPRQQGARPVEDGMIAEAARLAVRRSFARVLGWKPVAIVHVERATR